MPYTLALHIDEEYLRFLHKTWDTGCYNRRRAPLYLFDPRDRLARESWSIALKEFV